MPRRQVLMALKRTRLVALTGSVLVLTISLAPAGTGGVRPPRTVTPETSLTAHPARPSRFASASFGFVSSVAGSGFRCRLDGSGWAACTSPSDYAGLAEGWRP